MVDNKNLSDYQKILTEKGKQKWLNCSKVMNNGMSATIISYFNCENITVQFEDGYIVEHRTICNFRQGNIANPNIRDKFIQDRLGLTNTMSNGMNAKIIGYNTYKDIDVEFSDGAVVKHATMKNFKIGNIGYPEKDKSFKFKKMKEKYIGQRIQMSSGLWAEIVDYNNSADISVRFENGNVRHHISLGNFQAGHVSDEEKSKDSGLIGSKRFNPYYRMEVTIIGINPKGHAIVQFEDGAITQTHTDRFFSDKIAHPTISRKSAERIGVISSSREGFNARIVKYNSVKNFDIEFTDGKKLTLKIDFKRFTNANFSYPGFRNGFGTFHNYFFRGLNFELNGEKFYNVVKPNGESEVLTIREVMDLCNIVPLF